MLGAIRDRAKGILSWVIVGLIAIPFTLWGINNYFQDKGETIAASVNGKEITLVEFRTAFQRYTQQMRMLMGDSFSETTLDDPKVRKKVLNELIEQRLLIEEIGRLKLAMNDSDLIQVIGDNQAFHDENGVFDNRLYQSVLGTQGLTPALYESKLRTSILSDQLISALALSAFVTQEELKDIARLRFQKREIGYGIIPAAQFNDSIEINEDKLHQFYEDYKEDFRVPNQVVINYLHLKGETLAKEAPISEEELQAFYEETKAQYTKPEQRRVSHILISLAPDASEKDKQAAQERIDAILVTLKDKSFEEVAKEDSQDSGSARNGGDLGFFGKGTMDPAFEEAAFSLKNVGDITDPVLSKFGYHIIKLTDTHTGEVKAFDQVKEDLVAKYRQRKVEDEFYEKADTLDNLAYENPSSLEIAANALGLPIETSNPFSKDGLGTAGIMTNPKIIETAFSEEVLDEGVNSQTIELGDHNLVVLRINKSIPTHIPEFSDIHEKVQAKMILAESKIKAETLGQQLIKQLEQGEWPQAIFGVKNVDWHKKEFYTHNFFDTQINPEVLRVVYDSNRPKSEIPIFTGDFLSNGDYAVLGIYKVEDGVFDKLDENVRKGLTQEIERSRGEIAYRSFVEGLKEKAKIKIYTDSF
ncbi:SurA N-terminal domain-containing protein [Candidatus Nitrosacidococcus sp. I8]|uniref:SurA N-terminal domain-containing protein n=1 Tax=Candidatus Nitrosacidococcus sp. I8 TaxID=2942908 RepID=UPI00222730BA|nr:SurA N-terminal domain-containing protein [Candidatus Nitrosacidococcus sp. I8]CAH9019012.1 Peptidyl-prolyl cis-trans isomerase D [Candidatus Nitrosacidococcus sp. I8]